MTTELLGTYAKSYELRPEIPKISVADFSDPTFCPEDLDLPLSCVYSISIVPVRQISGTCWMRDIFQSIPGGFEVTAHKFM